MDAEDYKEFKDRAKAAKLARQESNTDIIVNWCVENEVQFFPLMTWQIRLNHNSKMLDIFTQSRKWHDISINERGQIEGDMRQFLNKHFEIKSVTSCK